MKLKSLFSAAFIFSSSLTMSQTINKTYELPYYDLTTKCIVEKTDDSAIFFTATAYSSQMPTKNLLIAKTDQNGNFIQAILIDSIYNYEKHRLIGIDSGTLLATYNDTDLHVVKFDLNQNIIWSIIVPMNGQLGISSYNFIDIERSYDPNGEEVYYIVNTAPSPIQQFQGIDDAISVTKIHRSGTLLWHKLYTDNNRPAQPFSFLRDQPTNITHIDSLHNEFSIVGMRSVADTLGTNRSRELFIFSIDQNGIVTTPYKEISTLTTNPTNPDIVWDSRNNVIACSYHENIGTLPAPVKIGLITFDQTLMPISGKNYDFTCINYPNSITVVGDTSYIIGTFLQECGSGITNSAFINIDNTTLSPLYLSRYNYQNPAVVNNSYHVDDKNGYQYMIPYTYRTTQSARMIKADFTLNACGAKYEEVNDTSYVPMSMDYTYADTNNDTSYTYTLYYQTVSLNVDDCDTSIDKDKYKPTALPYSRYKASVSVYPTSIDQYSFVNCDINTPKDTRCQIIVINTLGQIIYKADRKVNQGENKMKIESNQFSQGLNIVRVILDGTDSYSFKIIK